MSALDDLVTYNGGLTEEEHAEARAELELLREAAFERANDILKRNHGASQRASLERVGVVSALDRMMLRAVKEDPDAFEADLELARLRRLADVGAKSLQCRTSTFGGKECGCCGIFFGGKHTATCDVAAYLGLERESE